MKILGNRLLVSRVEEEKKDGFQTVEVQDNFVYKGKVEQGELVTGMGVQVKVGDIIIFAKYSRNTHEVDVAGQKMKVVAFEDVLAVL